TIDRTFPHTLRVVVRPEHAVMLLRRGRDDAWAGSSSGRVMREVAHPERSTLPPARGAAATPLTGRGTLPPTPRGPAAAALGPARDALGGRIHFVRSGGKELTFVLRSGLEIRLGEIHDLRLKLAIARRIVTLLGPDATTGGYLDVSVPERPVVGSTNPQ